MAPETSGWLFLGLIRFVKSAMSEQHLKNLIATVPEETQQRVFAEIIRPVTWYLYEDFAASLRALDAIAGHDNGKTIKLLGIDGGKRMLDTIFSVYRSMSNPERFARSAPSTWSRMFRHAGHMEPIAWEPQNTVWRIIDFPEMDPLHCLLHRGWLKGVLENMGCALQKYPMETKCTSKGNPYHEFVCRWTFNK